MHFFHDVAATYKLTLNVNLWDCWPITIVFYSLPEIFIIKNINIFEILNAVKLHDLNDVIWKTTSRHFSIAFHENSNVVCANPLGNLVFKRNILFFLWLWLKITVAIKVWFVRCKIIPWLIFEQRVVILILKCLKHLNTIFVKNHGISHSIKSSCKDPLCCEHFFIFFF